MNQDTWYAIVFAVVFTIGIALVWVLGRRTNTWIARKQAEARGQPDPTVPRVHLERSPQVIAADPDAFAMAASALYATRFRRFGDEFDWHDGNHEMTDMLRASWQITNRDELLEQLWSLLVAGHRHTHDETRRLVTERPDELERVRAELHRDGSHDARESLLTLQRLADNEQDARNIDFAAFDLVRVIMLARVGEGTGMLSTSLARDTARFAAHAIQSSYRDWNDYSWHLLGGRWIWSGLNHGAKADNREVAAIERAQSQRGGMRTFIAFDSAIPAAQLELLDALSYEQLEYGGTQLPRGTRPWERWIAGEVARRLMSS